MTTPATADWALPKSGGPDPDSESLWQRIAAWWAEFSLQTKLLAIATLVVSLVMTGITFLALSGIQRDAVMNDTRYARIWDCFLPEMSPNLWPRGRTENWLMWQRSSGAPAAAFATSFSPIPMESFTSAFPSVRPPQPPKETSASIGDSNCLRNCGVVPRTHWYGNTSLPRAVSQTSLSL